MEKVLVLEPDNYSAYSLLGMLYDELKIYIKCDSLYEKALTYYPDNPLFLNNYAYSLSERGERLEYALEMATRAVKAEPDNSAYQDTIGWIYYMLGRYNMALVHIKRSVEQQDDSSVVNEHLGDVYLKLGDLQQARNQWERALELDSGNERLKQKIENIQHEM
jgi:Flp pilus assembly protein TadD